MQTVFLLMEKTDAAPQAPVPSAGLDAETIAAHAGLRPVLKAQARAFLGVQQHMPRLAAIFATHQRYLLAQLAAALAFESGGAGMVVAQFLEEVRRHGIASRNTAHGFVQEMLHYGFAQPGAPGLDRRARPLVMSADVIAALAAWLSVHLRSLDALDGGRRGAAFEAEPDFLSRVHPFVVRRILASPASTQPIKIFAWMNDGGLLLDRIYAGAGETEPDGERVFTDISSLTELSEPLRISRAHLSRQLAASERDGHIGWQGKKGASPFWVSPRLLGEYEAYQIDKLTNIEAALRAGGWEG